jgi:hypothetical protein
MRFTIVIAILLNASLYMASAPRLDRAQVISLATSYAHEQKWDVKTVFRDASFNEKTREWQVLIQTKQNGGPMIVFVSDDTKKVHHVRGE